MIAISSLMIGGGCGDASKKQAPPPVTQKLPEDAGPTEEEMRLEREANERRDKLKAIAQEKYEAEMAKEEKFDAHGLRKRMVMEKFKIDLDAIPAEPLDKEQVMIRIHEQAIERANYKYSDAKRQKIVKQAEKEFPLYEIGSEVDVTTRRGTIRGALEAVYPDKVKVEKYYILKSDIYSPPSVCFDKEECEKRRNHFIRVHFDISRDDYIKRLKKELMPTVFQENGYVHINKKWVHINEVIEAKINPIVEKMEAEYNEKLDAAVKERVENEMREEGLIP